MISYRLASGLKTYRIQFVQHLFDCRGINLLAIVGHRSEYHLITGPASREVKDLSKWRRHDAEEDKKLARQRDLRGEEGQGAQI